MLYFYLNIKKLGINSIELSNKILEQTGVVVTPGNDFDKKYGSDFIRLAFSGKKEIVAKGIKNWLIGLIINDSTILVAFQLFSVFKNFHILIFNEILVDDLIEFLTLRLTLVLL